jgi:iron(II)-dependent oxidoreductase
MRVVYEYRPAKEAVVLDREALVVWYRRNRERSRILFNLLTDDAYYSQPIALRHPIVFYEGHLPAFSFNTLVKRGLGCASIDPRLETLFARGIDPEPPVTVQRSSPRPARPEPASPEPATLEPPKPPSPASANPGPARTAPPPPTGLNQWPDRAEVVSFAEEADRRVLDALSHADIERPGSPLLDRAEAVFTILEHEAMHQETLLYMWHRLAFDQKKSPADYAPVIDGRVPASEWIDVPAGHATLGVDRDAVRFGWDNEFPSRGEDVAAFAIERHNVTNARFLEFVDGGGYDQDRWWAPGDWAWIREQGIRHPLFWERADGRWHWRGMFELMPLPLSWPVYVSHAEAAAYARWRGGRLPTEAEYQRAAYGSAAGERRYPWGDLDPGDAHGVFDFSSWEPQPAGTHPRGSSAWGVEDLIGNGWEWTGTAFGPFPGFRAMASYPEYSADFFDGDHFVMKGASPATARELIRPTFRNWFRAHYPYVYASFRCARSLS